MLDYQVFHTIPWGMRIAVYFWLVGASAGSFVISSLGWVFGVKKYKPIALPASITAIILLLIVPIILIADLGQPQRFWYLLRPDFWHASSPMAWGTLLISAYPGAMLIYSWFVYKENEFQAKVWGILSIILAVSTHWYTGIVMALNPSREINHTSLAPILFLTGAFVSGIGFLIIVLFIRNLFLPAGKQVGPEMFTGMGRLMAWGLVFDLFLIFSEFLQMSYGTGDEIVALRHILLGVFSVQFLWLEVIFGIIAPLIILFSGFGRSLTGIVIASVLVDIGVMAMRQWWTIGGLYFQTYFQ